MSGIANPYKKEGTPGKKVIKIGSNRGGASADKYGGSMANIRQSFTDVQMPMQENVPADIDSINAQIKDKLGSINASNY